MKRKQRSVSESRVSFHSNLSQYICGYDHYKVRDLHSSIPLSFSAVLERALFFERGQTVDIKVLNAKYLVLSINNTT